MEEDIEEYFNRINNFSVNTPEDGFIQLVHLKPLFSYIKNLEIRISLLEHSNDQIKFNDQIISKLDQITYNTKEIGKTLSIRL